MMKITVIPLIVVVLAAAGLLYASQRDTSPVDQTPPPAAPAEPTPEPPIDPEPVNPLSLVAAQQKEYNGRDLTLGRVLDDNSVYTRYYATYKSGDLTISGIMNIPKGDGPFPVIITNHGHIDTDVYTNGRGLKREQDYLARRGFAVLHPDYRCHADSDCPDVSEVEQRLGYTEDVINALKAVQKSDNPKLDKEKIGMLGHSMGGGVNWSVSILIDDVDAFVQFAPVSADVVDSYNRWLVTRPEVVAEVREAYGEPSENPEFWREISPITYFDQINAPFQIHHGTADDDVPVEWSEKTTDRLKELGKSVELFTYPGQPHEFTSAWGTVMQRTVDFFREKLQ